MLADKKVSDLILLLDMKESQIETLKEALRDAQRQISEYYAKIMTVKQQIDESPLNNIAAGIYASCKETGEHIASLAQSLYKITEHFFYEQDDCEIGFAGQYTTLLTIKRQFYQLSLYKQEQTYKANKYQKMFETQYNELMQRLSIDPCTYKEEHAKQELRESAKSTEKADDTGKSDIEEQLAQLKYQNEQFQEHFKVCQNESAELYYRQVGQLEKKVEEMRRENLVASKEHAEKMNRLQLENDELRLKRDDLKEQCQLKNQQVEAMKALMSQIRSNSIAKNNYLQEQLKKLNERQNEDFAKIKSSLQRVEEERYYLTMLVYRHEREYASRKESVALEQRKISGNLAEIEHELCNIFKETANDFKSAQPEPAGESSWFVIEQDIYALARFVACKLYNAVEDVSDKNKCVSDYQRQIGELKIEIDELKSKNEQIEAKSKEQVSLLKSELDLAQDKLKENYEQKTLEDLTIADMGTIKKERRAELDEFTKVIEDVKDMLEQTQRQAYPGQSSFADRSGRFSRAGSRLDPTSRRSSAAFAAPSAVQDLQARRSGYFPDAGEAEADTPLAEAKTSAAAGLGASRNAKDRKDRKSSRDDGYFREDGEDGREDAFRQLQPTYGANYLYPTVGRQRGRHAIQTDAPGLEYTATQVGADEPGQEDNFRGAGQYNQPKSRQSDTSQQFSAYANGGRYESATQRANRECRPPIDDKIRRIIQEKKPLTSYRLNTMRRWQE